MQQNEIIKYEDCADHQWMFRDNSKRNIGSKTYQFETSENILCSQQLYFFKE